MNMHGSDNCVYCINLKLKNCDDWLNEEDLNDIIDFYQDGDFVTFVWSDGEIVINKDDIISFLAVKVKKGENDGKTKKSNEE